MDRPFVLAIGIPMVINGYLALKTCEYSTANTLKIIR